MKHKEIWFSLDGEGGVLRQYSWEVTPGYGLILLSYMSQESIVS